MARDVLRELSESAARTLGTTPDQLDEAWDRAELRMVQRVLERRGVQMPTSLAEHRSFEDGHRVALPSPLGVKAPLSTGDSSTSLQSLGLIPTWDVGQPKYPRQNLGNWVEQGYRRNELAFSCVREVAQSASEPRLRVKLSRDPEAPYVDDHPAAEFVERPNPRMTQSLWLMQLLTLAQVGGNGIAWKERSGGDRVIGLHWLRSDRIKLEHDFDGSIAAYWYMSGSKEVRLPARDVFHFPYVFDPLNPTWGLSPFAVLARQVSVDNTTTDFQAKFFEQAGVPYGLITTEQLLNDTDAEAIATRWQQRYAGMEGWHRPAVLGQGARYERMGLSMQEMQVDELRSIPESRICSAFQVPPILVGAKVGLDRSTFSNYEEARKSFWAETLRPIYRQIADLMNLHLAPEFGSDVRFEFDLSDVGALQAAEGEKWERAGKAFAGGWISDNEARQEVGLNPWPVARRMLTVAMAPEDAPEAIDDDSRAERRAQAGGREVKLTRWAEGKATGEELERALARSQAALVPPFETRVTRLYRAIARRVADRAQSSKASGRAELKVDATELLPVEEQERINELVVAFAAVVGEQTVELLNGLYPLGASFDPPASYYERASSDARAMYETLQDRVREVLDRANAAGWSTDELVDGDDSAAGLEAAIAGSSGDDRDGVHVLTATAGLVALDQYVSSRNTSSTLAYEQGGVSFVDVRDGTDHDDECARANGQRWALDFALSNASQHPNCVRTFVPVFERES